MLEHLSELLIKWYLLLEANESDTRVSISIVPTALSATFAKPWTTSKMKAQPKHL